MSVVQSRSEPTLGTVRPKSRLEKLLDARARLRHQVELRRKPGCRPSRVAECGVGVDGPLADHERTSVHDAHRRQLVEQ